jgi:hypothetical protein
VAASVVYWVWMGKAKPIVSRMKDRHVRFTMFLLLTEIFVAFEGLLAQTLRYSYLA